jgi:hypothetical protein
MKSIVKSNLGLPMTAVFLTAVLIAPAAALAGPVTTHPVPFKGSVHAVETFDVQPPSLFSEGVGTGEATHLGRYTVTYQVEVDLMSGAGVGSAHFIAANGDSLLAEFVGQGTPTADPNISSIEETYTITGGTGRFAGATGSFTMERLINLATGVTSGSFDGAIVIQR